jgi:hypothetical protein
MKNKELRLKAQEYIKSERIESYTYQTEKAYIDGAKMAEKESTASPITETLDKLIKEKHHLVFVEGFEDFKDLNRTQDELRCLKVSKRLIENQNPIKKK